MKGYDFEEERKRDKYLELCERGEKQGREREGCWKENFNLKKCW